LASFATATDLTKGNTTVTEAVLSRAVVLRLMKMLDDVVPQTFAAPGKESSIKG